MLLCSKPPLGASASRDESSDCASLLCEVAPSERVWCSCLESGVWVEVWYGFGLGLGPGGRNSICDVSSDGSL